MARARQAPEYYYEVTRKNPGKLRPGSIKAIAYDVMRNLRRAGEARVVDEVLAHKDFRTRQEDPATQVRWYLNWDFVQRGLVRRIESRRYRSRSDDNGAVALTKPSTTEGAEER